MFYDNFKLMKYYILFFLSFLMTGCQLQDGSGTSDADKALTSWADAYFNFNYEKALEYMTPESGRWIRFAASNITEQDVAFIKEQNPQTQIEIVNSQLSEADTVCNANIHVSHFIQLGFSAQDNQVVDGADFQIQLVKRNGNWLVRTEGLPRSGKQSRD